MSSLHERPTHGAVGEAMLEQALLKFYFARQEQQEVGA